MKISILGSEGYIGTAFRLHPRIRHIASEIQRIDACLYDQPRAGVCYVRFNDTPGVLSYLSHFDPDVVMNLAALAHDPQNQFDPMSVDSCNALLPQHVANWCLERGKRFITVSSLSVHGEGAYPRSKRLMEENMYRLGIPRGIDIVRFGTIFGVVPDLPWRYMRPHLLLNSMVLDACLHGTIQVNGNMNRPVTALHDAVSCLGDMVCPQRAPGQVINRYWCSANLYEWAGIIQQVFDEVEGIKVKALDSKPSPDNRSYFFQPHAHVFPWKVLRDTLAELVRYTRTYQYPLARWRKTQMRILYHKLHEWRSALA